MIAYKAYHPEFKFQVQPIVLHDLVIDV